MVDSNKGLNRTAFSRHGVNRYRDNISIHEGRLYGGDPYLKSAQVVVEVVPLANTSLSHHVQTTVQCGAVGCDEL